MGLRKHAADVVTPAMDIQVASNFERYLYYRLGEDSGRVEAMMARFAREEGCLSVGLPDGRAEGRDCGGDG